MFTHPAPFPLAFIDPPAFPVTSYMQSLKISPKHHRPLPDFATCVTVSEL